MVATGSMLAWVDRSGLHVAKGEGTSPRLLVHDGRCTRVCAGQLSFAWSPDGRKLLVGGAGKQDTRFLVVDMRSGDVKDLVAPRPSVLYRAIDWSSDGSWIAYLRSSGDPLGHTCCDDAVYISRPDGSRARRLVSLLDPIHDSAYASFSPDSRSLAVATCCDAPPQLRIVDLRSGRIQLVPRVSVGDSTPQWSPDSKLFSEGVALVNRRGRIARTLGRGTDVRRWTGRGALVLVKMVETKKHGLRQIVVVSPQARSRPRFVFRLPAIQGLLSIDSR